MTTTMTMSGTPLHFPGAIQIGADGVIEAPPREELARLCIERVLRSEAAD